MALTEYFVLRTSAPQYLSFVTEKNIEGYLKGDNNSVISPYVKFGLERVDGGHVHIRSCYNNKYWVRLTDGENIVAKAEKKVDDKTSKDCTLFNPTVTGETVYFTHVQSGLNLMLDSSAYLKVGSTTKQVFSIVQYNSLTILPQFVVFQCDAGRYLRGWSQGGHAYINAGSNDARDAANVHEIFYTDDGEVRIKSKHFGKFWRRSPNWIWADSSDTTSNNKDTLFEVVHDSINDVIGLKNKGNDKFCRRLTLDGKENCLNAAASTMIKETQLKVTEPLISRTIEVTQYHTDRARIYNETIEALADGEGVNNSATVTTNVGVSMTYRDSKTSSWSNSISITLGFSATFKAGVPFIGETEFEIKAEVNDTYQWGKSTETAKEVTGSYTAPVPPMTKVKVTLLATRGTCDIPFSYLQVDQYTSGERVTTTLHDGLYTGANYYHFHYDSKEEPLSKSELEELDLAV